MRFYWALAQLRGGSHEITLTIPFRVAGIIQRLILNNVCSDFFTFCKLRNILRNCQYTKTSFMKKLMRKIKMSYQINFLFSNLKSMSCEATRSQNCTSMFVLPLLSHVDLTVLSIFQNLSITQLFSLSSFILFCRHTLFESKV